MIESIARTVCVTVPWAVAQWNRRPASPFWLRAAGHNLRAVKVCLRNPLGGLFLIENF